MEWNFNIFHIILGDKFFKENFRNKITFKLYVSGIDFLQARSFYLEVGYRDLHQRIFRLTGEKYSSELFQQCQRAQNWISR